MISRRWLSLFWLNSSLLLVILWGYGQFVRDWSWLTGLMFYVPSPLVCLWLLLAVWQLRRPAASDHNSANWPRRICLMVLTVPLCVVGFVENQWTVPPRPAKSAAESGGDTPAATRLRLIHWNVCRPARLWEQQKLRIRAQNADVIVLSEISDSITDTDFAGYFVVRRKAMLIAARWPIDATGGLVTGGAMHAFCVRAVGQANRPVIMIADMASAVHLARDPFLRPLIAQSVQLKADLIVGDLNAPRRSRALSDLPPGYAHAYHAAGSGWSYTWPIPMPVLAIDQCVCGPRVQPVNYQLQSSVLSDHRMQILDFDFPVSQ